MMPVVYLLHPVSGDIEGNLKNAKLWVRWLYDNFRVAVLAHWILDCEVLDDNNPEHRARWLANDETLINKCDLMLAVGGTWSKGMLFERDVGTRLAKPLIDMHLWRKPSSNPPNALQFLMNAMKRWRIPYLADETRK